MILLWIPMFLFIGLTKLLFTVLGIFLIPLAVLFKSYHSVFIDKFDKEVLLFTWPIMFAYQNLEDGIVAGDEFLDKPLWFRITYWSAIRNPANGLRFIKIFAPIPEPSKVKYKASFGNEHKDYWTLVQLEEKGSFWYLAWQGPYANFRWQFWTGKKLWRIWIGTKIYPSSMFQVQNYQKHGIGTTFQIKDVTRFE